MAINELDEKDLISKVLAGEKDLYRELVIRNQNQIFSMIMRQLGQFELAEEICQEVFLKAYKNLKHFRAESKFSSWLYRIALNELGHLYESKDFKKNRKTDSLPEEFKLVSKTNPESDIDTKNLIDILRSCFSKLKSDYRQILALAAFEGQPYEDIADLFNIPVGTIKSRLNKARLLVKDCMERQGAYE